MFNAIFIFIGIGIGIADVHWVFFTAFQNRVKRSTA